MHLGGNAVEGYEEIPEPRSYSRMRLMRIKCNLELHLMEL